MRASWNARVLAALVALVAAAALIAAPPTDDGGQPRADEVARLLRLAAASTRPSGGRPPFRPRPVTAVGLAAPAAEPPEAYGPVQTVEGPEQRWPLAFADGALPFSYEVDRELADRVGLRTVLRAMSAWDGVEGSRWRTRFVRMSRRPLDEAYPDGVSTVYLRKQCRGGLLGSVHWQLSPSVASVDVRGGTGGVYTAEVDIALCPRAGTPELAHRTLLHEVGHVMGLEHLCERGGRCPDPLGDIVPRCRVMHWRLSRCGAEVREAEEDLARHLYPTLPRLWGPDVVRTAIRATYATVPTQAARRVVLARPGTHPWRLAPALLEAAPDDAPLLLADPDLGSCVPDPVGGELARAAAPGAVVTLVGTWPSSCEAVLRSWGLRVERHDAPGAPGGPGTGGRAPGEPTPAAESAARRWAAQLAAADRLLARRGTQAAELVIASRPTGLYGGGLEGAETATAWAAAALAAEIGAPLVLVGGGRLPTALEAWLRERPQVRHVHAVGGAEALHPLLLHQIRRLGLGTSRVPGVSPARVTAGTIAAFPGTAPLFVAPLAAPDEQAIAASLAMRTGGPLVVVAGETVRHLVDALGVRRARGGALVAGPADVPPSIHWTLTRRVQPAADQRLDMEWRFRGSA